MNEEMKKKIMKAMCGSDEPHSYPVRKFSYRTEQARAVEVQEGI
jgi:hypothetical protein